MEWGGVTAAPSSEIEMEKKQTPSTQTVEILRDGVFIAEDVRANKGDKPEVSRAIAKILIANGHAK